MRYETEVPVFLESSSSLFLLCGWIQKVVGWPHSGEAALGGADFERFFLLGLDVFMSDTLIV